MVAIPVVILCLSVGAAILITIGGLIGYLIGGTLGAWIGGPMFLFAGLLSMYFWLPEIVRELVSVPDTGDSDRVEARRPVCQRSFVQGLAATDSGRDSLSREVERLAVLKAKGLISEREFRSFTEAFKISTAERAIGVLKATEVLSKQYRKKAINESTYRDSLWRLLEKLT